MAKRKNATALFEVMHNDKRPTPRSAGSLFGGNGGGGGAGGGLSSWWPFGGGGAKKRANDRTSGSPSMTHIAERDGADESVYDPTMPDRVAASFPTSHSAMSPSAMAMSHVEHDAPGADYDGEVSAPRVSSAAMFDFSVDSEHQVIHVNLSYTSAAVAGFAVAVALALAFILGRHGARHAIPALAEQTTEELRRGPTLPGVMDVSPDDNSATANAAVPAGSRIGEPAATATGARAAAAAATTHPAVTAGSFNEPKPPQTNIVLGEKRTVGMNYVVIQNYFDDRKAAEDARDVLIKRGILCTVERGPEGWASTKWFSVVGITGFDKTKRSPDYEKYVADIMKVSKEFAGTSRFKQFDPQPFKWREQKTAN